MPKKKDPRMRALEQQNAGTKKYFDSAEYEVQRARAQNTETRDALREAAGKAPHVPSQPSK